MCPGHVVHHQVEVSFATVALDQARQAEEEAVALHGREGVTSRVRLVPASEHLLEQPQSLPARGCAPDVTSNSWKDCSENV